MRRAVAVALAAALVGSVVRAEEPTAAGRPLKEWAADLRSADVLTREEAIEVLAGLGSAAKEFAPAIERLLKDEAATVRRRAALALLRIDGRRGPAVAAVAEMLRDPSRAVRSRAVRLLPRLGADAAGLAPALAEGLEADDPTW
jgi:HEAT repeat protein